MEPLCPVGRNRKLVQPLQKQHGGATKIENRIIFNPAIPFLKLWTKETKTKTREEVCTPMFIAALFIVNKIGKQVSFNG